jgi:hypothetical protein
MAIARRPRGRYNGPSFITFMRRALFVFLLSLLPAWMGAAEFRLKVNHTGANAAVELSGDAGKPYLIESSVGSADRWSPISSFVLTNASRLWTDAAASSGNRFFRARVQTEDDAQYANNFRLIDQNGVARELYYYHSLPSLRAIVLVFAEGNYGSFAPKIAQLKTSFPTGVFFWTVETGLNNSRSNIVKEAAAAGVTWPIFYDPMQLVTRDFGAHFTGEAVVISPGEMNIVYRGVIDDGANNYVREALGAAVNNTQMFTTRWESAVNGMAMPARPVADYATVIAPILQAKCVACHSIGNIAPFSMTNYQSVLDNAAAIRDEVLEHNMPPWHADPEYGKFHNDISLTRQETAQLIDWIAAGAPRGNGPDPLLIPPPAPTSKWPPELGEPDQIVTIPVQQISATGVLPYRYIYATATNATDKWLRAAVVHPGNTRVVHHYIVWQGWSSSAQLSGIAAYAPGRTERPFPTGTGILLPANCQMTFNCHYTVDGQDETDQPELGLWYASTPPSKELKQAPIINPSFTFGLFSIPAGNPDFEVTASQTFSSPVRLFSFAPHMHFRGARMRFELTVPGVPGKQILLSVPHYNFDWQTIYTLETPLDLPTNSKIDVIGAFDNSAQNVDNPNPNIAVKWGEQSFDEMFIGYIEYSLR